ncbi:MAG: hypothetical protein M3T56_19415 [Chloroflexota bacterium]|nr:hypothetical protein [Chloroflexota bacterium]
MSIVEHLQPAVSSVMHLHESEFVYALEGPSTLEYTAPNGLQHAVVSPGSAAIDSPLGGAHVHRNDTSGPVRWYGIRFIGPSSPPAELFASSRIVYLSPPIAPAAIASGHIADLRLLTMTAGSQTPSQRPTFLIVAFVLSGSVDLVRGAAHTRLAAGEGMVIQPPDVVKMVAGNEETRLLTIFAAASGRPIMSELRD